MAESAFDYSTVVAFQVRPIGGGKPPGPPLQPPSGGGTSGGMDGWQTSVEARLGEIRTDIRDLRSDIGGVRSGVSDLNANLATLTEKVAHLPSKGFIVKATLLALAFIAAVVTFQGHIQTLLKLH